MATAELPTVLLVDDDAVLLRIYSRILTSESYELVSAETVQEALEAAAELGTRLAVLVTDQRLEDGKGTELAGELCQKHPGLEVLILTGDPDAIEGFDVMCKPFANDELVGAVMEKIMRVSPQR